MQRVVVPASSSSPNTRQRVELEGREFIIEFAWNGRLGAWFARVADAADVDLRRGIRLVDGAALLSGIVDPRRPAGELVIATRASVIGVDAFDNGDASLVYFTAAEVAAARPLVATSLVTGVEIGEPVDG